MPAHRMNMRKIEDAYGDDRRALERELATIKARLTGGLAGRIVARLKRLPERQGEVEKTLANIAMRTAEIRDPIRARCEAEATSLCNQQQREKAQLENLFEDGEKSGWRIPAGYEPPTQRIDRTTKSPERGSAPTEDPEKRVRAFDRRRGRDR